MHKIEAEHFTQMTFFSPRKKKQKRVRDDFKAFLVEGARFTSIEQYPIIEPWMIPDVDEIRVVPFNKIDRISNLEDYYICFYCRDKDFRKTMNNPKQYLKLFRRAKGLIGFDFSVYSDMPIVKQRAQMYDSLALSFFYGMRNIPVIPNIRYGNESTRDEFLTAIPKHSVISIGSYGCVRSNEEKRVFKAFLSDSLPVLQPNAVAVYGAMPDDVFGDFHDQYTFIHCPAYIENEMREVG